MMPNLIELSDILLFGFNKNIMGKLKKECLASTKKKQGKKAKKAKKKGRKK
jgi:hypothetical protein